MQKYRVMVHGENLWTEVDGERQRLGFYTNVFVEAWTAAEAGIRAMELVRGDAKLTDVQLNPEDDPVRLSVDEIGEIESFEGYRVPRDGFMLYPETES